MRTLLRYIKRSEKIRVPGEIGTKILLIMLHTHKTRVAAVRKKLYQHEYDYRCQEARPVSGDSTCQTRYAFSTLVAELNFEG